MSFYTTHNMRGHVLITIMVLLTVMSFSILYSARESLLMMQMARNEQKTLQLSVLTDEALMHTAAFIENLPIDTRPIPLSACKMPPCLLSAESGNFFLEQDLRWWMATHNPARIWLPLSTTTAALVLEEIRVLNDTNVDTQHQFLRTTLFLTDDQDTQQLIQATWRRSMIFHQNIEHKGATLTTINSIEAPVRLSFRRG